MLVERGPHLLELSSGLAEAARGRGRAVFVGGEAGAGKTSLLARFRSLVGDGADVVVGHCDPRPTPSPLTPLLDVVDRLPGARLRTGAGPELLRRDLLSALSAGVRPLVLAFEDVHWADQATLDLLAFVARRIDGCRALLVATWRTDEVHDGHPLRRMLGELATAPAVRRLTLPPLGPDGVRALVGDRGIDVDALLRRTGGNPFFVTEVLASGDARLPETVRDAVLARAGRLAAPARAVLDAAAVIGPRCEPWLLERSVGADIGSLQDCIAAGLLAGAGDGVAFGHELVREAVLGALPPHRCLDLHRRVLAALLAAPPATHDAARLAHHAEAAADLPAVLEHAARAALRASELGAHREAANQYARLLRFGDGLPAADRIVLLTRHAAACAVADRPEDAIGSYEEAVRIAQVIGDVRAEGDTTARLAACLVVAGRNAQAEAAGVRAVELLERLPDSRELAEACVHRAALRMLDRDHAPAVEWARRALRLAERMGLEDVRVRALERLGTALMMSGDEQGRELLERSAALAGRLGAHADRARALSNLGSGLGELHEFELAARYLSEGIDDAATHEIESSLGYMRAWQAIVLQHQGRWDEAEAAARRVLRTTGPVGISRIAALVALGRVLGRRGDAGAGEVLDEALALAAPTGTLQRIAPVRIARAEAAWLAGRTAQARIEADAALALALDRRHPWMAGELLHWLDRTGDRRPVPDWIAEPFALQLAGRWSDAARSWELRGCPYEAALAAVETADPESVRAALATFERLGARPAAQLAMRRLRATGARGARGAAGGPGPADRARPAGLTAREVEVVRCVAEGQRNAEIAARLGLSPKTVDHHVSRLMGKLGARSRTEAARAAQRLGLLRDDDPGASS